MSLAETLLVRDIGRDQLVAELRVLRPAFEREGVVRMSLIGSRARGDNRPDSDVDLMIEVVPDRRFSLVEIARIMRAVEEHVGLSANVLMRRSMKPSFLVRALEDKVPVF